MQKIVFHTTCRKMLADVFTPVGIYLRLRDRFRDTVLLESTDYHSSTNSFSFIGVNAVAGIEIGSHSEAEIKFPGHPPQRIPTKGKKITDTVNSFQEKFQPAVPEIKEARFAQGLYGYTSFDALPLFENAIKGKSSEIEIPVMRYRLYQYVIAINHFSDELFLCENHFDGIESEISLLESLIRNKDVPVFPFRRKGEERSSLRDSDYLNMVTKGIDYCHRGDVFQVVLSRRFSQPFNGDDFNVYRALRSVNPSPYLFYFDYGDYHLFGSSPESQLIVSNNVATVHPIAGTAKRTGNDEADEDLKNKLLEDAKENAEHVMLVDLARNDLSRVCSDVHVSKFREVHYYSHVIHLVSEVKGMMNDDKHAVELLAASFPAGTLSGAPKIKAVQIIHELEPSSRGYYGGAIGFLGFNDELNHAIMIRTFYSRNNTLHYQAGAGIVAASVPENELNEVNNKLGALKKAIALAEQI